MSLKPPRLAVLVSGRGGNLQAIMQACAAGKLKAMVVLVISDQLEAYALERASKVGIPTRIVERKKFSSRNHFDQEISKFIAEFHVDWIILAGFMKVLGPTFVRAHQGKILNIHPSLLPKFPGMNAIDNAYAAGETTMGVTVHFVDEGVDTGPIVLQEEFYRQPTWTLSETQDIVHEIEHRVYPLAIAAVISGDITFSK